MVKTMVAMVVANMMVARWKASREDSKFGSSARTMFS